MAATHTATRENGECQPMKRQKQDPVNTVTVVLGSQWGDEGKGKLVDLLATEADVVCRCQVCCFWILFGGKCPPKRAACFHQGQGHCQIVQVLQKLVQLCV